MAVDELRTPVRSASRSRTRPPPAPDPPVEPLAGRVAAVHPQPRRPGRGRRLRARRPYCLIWPFVSPYDPNEIDFPIANQTPSLEHPFGTDRFGRDLFTRTAVGGRVSIGIGFAATIVILVIGIFYGSISGFVGGKLDNGMMRFLDALYGLPYLPFAIITLAIIGNTNF